MTERFVRASLAENINTQPRPPLPNATVDLDKDIPWSGVRLGEPKLQGASYETGKSGI
jgi:hypothetical protein